LFQWSQPRQANEQLRLNFITTDLDLCFTFATIAERKFQTSNREDAERTLAYAEKGYSEMLRFFSQAKGLSTEVEKALQSKFKHLRERLDGLQQRR
jgi:hypothetical protein